MGEEGGEENRGERATEEHNILKLTAHAWAVENEKGREKRSHSNKQRKGNDLEKNWIF